MSSSVKNKNKKNRNAESVKKKAALKQQIKKEMKKAPSGAKKLMNAAGNPTLTSANISAGQNLPLQEEGGGEGESRLHDSDSSDFIGRAASSASTTVVGGEVERPVQNSLGVTRIQSGDPFFANTDAATLNNTGSESNPAIHSPANSSISSITTNNTTTSSKTATAFSVHSNDHSISSFNTSDGNSDSSVDTVVPIASAGVITVSANNPSNRFASTSSLSAAAAVYQSIPTAEAHSPHSLSTTTSSSSSAADSANNTWQSPLQFHPKPQPQIEQQYSHLLPAQLQNNQLPFRRSIAGGQFIVSRAQQNVHQFPPTPTPPSQEQQPPAPSQHYQFLSHSQIPINPAPLNTTTRFGGPIFTRASTGQIYYHSTGVPTPSITGGEPSSSNLWIQNDPTRLYQSVTNPVHSHPPPQQQNLNPFGFAQPSTSNLSFSSTFMSGQDQNPHTLQRGASASSTTGYKCPNCAKTFARDDLLRRHLAREARAAAQPSLDRQKSCFECARSKARCDLEVPTCGRCRTRGKNCVYGARSGNPNVRKNVRTNSQELGVGGSGATPSMASTGGSQWQQTAGMSIDGSQWPPPAGMTVPSNAPPYTFPHKNEGSEEYESDDSRNWSDSYQQYRGDRTLSTSSSNTDNSFDYSNNSSANQQQNAYTMNYADQTSYLMGPSTDIDLVSSTATGRLSTSGIDTSVPRVRAEDDEQTPISRVVNAVMGPPQQVTPLRGTNTTSNWSGMVAQNPNSRPEVPRLLTGARMPRPAEAGQASARPLFSAQLDLSGWLEEPVIPSPLYRMGPSLSALGATNPHQFTLPTPTIATQAGNQLTSTMLPAPSNNQPSDSLMERDLSNNETTSDQTQQGRREEASSVSQHAQVAARNWWAAGQQERTSIDSQEVAQACAAHFTLYPALMVLPDATSPVPPLFHRPWLANTRLQTPASLAQVRVALAAYHVRLPASEPMVWEMIKSQAKSIVGSYDSLVHSSDMEVFSSTAALWFLVILMLMSSDPATGQFAGEGLTDSCLVGLSHLSWLLQQRVLSLEQTQIEQRRTQGAASPTFIDWGFLETMRRTLFACYALFVLQRFRPTSPELQSRLAGVELVMDVKLPATASEFEAGNELEWRAAQHVKITDDQGIALGGALTLRELLRARSAAQNQEMQQDPTSLENSSNSNPEISNTTTAGGNVGSGTNPTSESSSQQIPISEERRKEMLTYFDRHDDFTNVCLTVTFALDARIQ